MRTVAVAMMLLAAAPSLAADEAAPAGGVTGNATVYLWLSGLQGRTAVAGLPPVSFRQSFSDLFENLDFAVMGNGEVMFGRFGLYGDINYTKLTTTVASDRVRLEADVRNELLVGTVMGQFRAGQVGRSTVDLLAGVRFWDVKARLSARLLTPPGPFDGVSRTGGSNWVDPMVGAKARLQGQSAFSADVLALVGGFGAGSDIGWELYGGMGWDISRLFSLKLGYRAVGVDYDNGRFVYDTVQHGPLIGATLRF